MDLQFASILHHFPPFTSARCHPCSYCNCMPSSSIMLDLDDDEADFVIGMRFDEYPLFLNYVFMSFLLRNLCEIDVI